MATDFPKLSNNATGFVGPAGYTAGSHALTLREGGGARFPALEEGEWFAVTVIRAAVAYSPSATETDYTIFKVTGVVGDVLTLDPTPLDTTTDRSYAPGAVVQIRATEGTFATIHAAVNANESTVTALNTVAVKTTSSYANPPWLTQVAGSKVTDVIRTSGDQTIAGVKTHTDITVRDMTSLPVDVSHIASRILPHPTTLEYATGIVCSTNSDDSINPVVCLMGYNILGGAELIDPEQPGCRIAIEGDWLNAQGNKQFEIHLASMIMNDPGRTEFRPITVEIIKETGATLTKFYGSHVVWGKEDYSGVAKMVSDGDGAGSFEYSIFDPGNTDPETDAFAYQIKLGSDPTGLDRFDHGRGSAKTQVQYAGTGVALQFGVLGQPTPRQFVAGTSATEIGGSAAGLYLMQSGVEVEFLDSRVSIYPSLVLGAIAAPTAAQADIYGKAGGPVLRLRTNLAAGQPFLDLRDADTVTVATINAAGNLVPGNTTPIAKFLTATATLDFASTPAQSSADLTISLTGAAVGDAVFLGLPAAPAANTSFSAHVSAADTVAVRFNNYSSSAVDPASGTYRVAIIK